MSLGVNLGVLSSKPSGDFASKMWASYTQLNPGVYSDAIATEFKRRMKPDYVDSAGTGYYYNTFGPSGLNKTTADWIGIMVTSSSTAVRSNTKTGAFIKWNCDGTIFTQNSMPAYTKGGNQGIITFTSTDLFLGVTSFNLPVCNITHLSGILGFLNLTTFSCYSNYITNLALPSTDKIINLSTYSNLLPSINNIGSVNMSVDNEQNNVYPTDMVNSRLAYYNAMFAATPPIKNLTLNLSGATMGIPTGAGSNTDLLGILAKFTAAGFTATIIVRTS